MKNKYPYRKGVLAYIFDDNHKFLLLQPISYKENEWAILGGGGEKGETELENLYREINEEIGLSEIDYAIVGRSRNSIKYDFPKSFFLKKPDVKYKGQIKVQFLLKLTASKSKISINTNEIKTYKWVPINELKEHLIFPGQYEQLNRLLKEFSLYMHG